MLISLYEPYVRGCVDLPQFSQLSLVLRLQRQEELLDGLQFWAVRRQRQHHDALVFTVLVGVHAHVWLGIINDEDGILGQPVRTPRRTGPYHLGQVLEEADEDFRIYCAWHVFYVDQAVLVQSGYRCDAHLPRIMVQVRLLPSGLPAVASQLELVAAAFVDEDEPAVQPVESKQDDAPVFPQLPEFVRIFVATPY